LVAVLLCGPVGMEKLGALKVSPRGKKLGGLSDDILGKNQISLSQTTPLKNLKPLNQIDKDSLSKTQDIPSRKTVRLSDPLETGPSNVIELIPPIGSETISSPRGALPEIKPILKESTTMNSIGAESHEEINTNEVMVLELEKMIPPIAVEEPLTPLDITAVAEAPDDFGTSDQLPELSKTNQSDFNEMASLQAQESLIRQQYNTQTIRRMYSKILDRASVKNTLHAAILKGDDNLVEQVMNLFPNEHSNDVFCRS
jgi:hypothetical protein